MADKRNLPAWMIQSDNRKCKEKLKNSLKPKIDGCANKAERKKRPRRKMLYWMNERELMDTALSIIQKHTIKETTKKTELSCPVKTSDPTVIPETDGEASDSDGHEKTYVSDTDLDITEQKTLPYTDMNSESSGFRNANEVSRTADKKTETEDNTHSTNPYHDAFQLVQEIFFS